jgi:phospholipase D1/2
MLTWVCAAENQFFISATYDKDEVKNQIAAALVERIVRAAQNDQKFQVSSLALYLAVHGSPPPPLPPARQRMHWTHATPQVIVVIPEVPGFAGSIKDEGSLKIIMAAQYRTINRGGRSIYEEVRKAGFEPCVFLSTTL